MFFCAVVKVVAANCEIKYIFAQNKTIMQAIYSLGRWLFVLPFAVFGLFHFMNAKAMADSVVPPYFPAKEIFVYLTGVALIAAAISMATGKKDGLAALLLAGFLLLVVLTVHVPNAMDPMKGQMALTLMMKDIALIGSALMYAGYLATDKS
jgi:putative oxidoreductase